MPLFIPKNLICFKRINNVDKNGEIEFFKWETIRIGKN